MPDHRLPDGNQAVLLSADTPALLRAEAAALLDYMTNHPEVRPDRVAEMLFRSRSVRRIRALAAVSGRDELIAALRAVSTGAAHPAVVGGGEPAAERRHAFVFPGQGGQRPGMAALFHDFSPAFRAEAERGDALFGELFGISPLKYALGAEILDTGSSELVQPALFVQMTALAAMWRSAGIEPAATVGHSQGEIAAAYVAGKLTLRDAVFLVGTRARVVDTPALSSDRYAMAVAATDRDECEELLARRTGWAQLSVINAPRFVGISGDRATVAEIVAELEARGRFARIIRVPYPAHTDRLDSVRDDIRIALGAQFGETTFRESEIHCFGATLGGPITPGVSLPDYWFWNLRNTVRFDKAVAAAAATGVNSFVELAEHPTLVAAVHENLEHLGADATVTATSSRDASDAGEFSRALAALAVGDLNFHWKTLDTAPDRIRLPLRDFPNSQLEQQHLWLPYNTPAAAAVAPATASPAVTSGSRPAPTQLLVERWVRQTRRSLLPPRGFGFVDHTGACTELRAALCAQAEVFGATARPLNAGESPAGLDALVVLLPETTETDVAAAGEATAEFLGAATWWPGDLGSATEVWLVTRGGEQIDGDPPRQLYQAAVSAGFRSIGAEHPGISFRHLDLAAGPVDEPAAFAVIAALHTADETELVLRGQDQYVKRLTEYPTDISPAGAPGEQFGEVLIIGGTGKIGLEFCEHFARAGARRVTLVSRSGAEPAVAARLDRLRRSGPAEIVVHTADIRDDAAVRQLAGEFRDRPAELIVHTAVAYSDADLADITADAVRQAVATKIGGIDTVLDLVPRTEHCPVLVSSSIASTLSGRGQAVYAATNRMLDAYADRRRAAGVRCYSVQWGRWTVHLELGAAGTAKLDGMGATPMPPNDAISLGLRDIGENTLVAAFDWAHTASVLTPYGYGPVLAELAGPAPDAAVPPPAAAAPAPSAAGPVEPRLRALVAEVLGTREGAALPPGEALVALGLDSLLALGLRRRITAEFDCDIPVADLLGGATLDTILQRIGAQAPAPTAAERAGRAPAAPAVAAPAGRSNPVQTAERRSTRVQSGFAEAAASAGAGPAGGSPVGSRRPQVLPGESASTEIAAAKSGTADAVSGGTAPAEAASLQAAPAGDGSGPAQAAPTETGRGRSGCAEAASAGSRPAGTDPVGSVRAHAAAAGTAPTGAEPTRNALVQHPEDADIAEAARRAAEGAVPGGADGARIRSARADVDLFGMRAMLNTLDFVLGDGESYPITEIAERTGFQERHRWLLRRWLTALTEHGALEYDPVRGYRRIRAVAAPECADLPQVCADLGYPAELAVFLQATSDELPRIVRDEVRVQELLFPGGDMRTAQVLYTDNLISHYLNVGAGALVAGLTDRIAQDRTPVRILELGAGIGGLTGTVAENVHGHPVDYHFTDVSSFFLDAARERFSGYPWMRFGLADLNADLDTGLGTYDIVLAANVLHNARHIGVTLRQIHEMLAHGGAVVFVEVCRAHMQLLTSVHLLMSPPAGQPLVGISDVRRGTDRIMLTEPEWRAELGHAGFRVLDVLPHPDHPLFPLDQRVFAAVKVG